MTACRSIVVWPRRQMRKGTGPGAHEATHTDRDGPGRLSSRKIPVHEAVHRFIRVLLPVADVKYGLSWRAGGPPFHTRLRLVIGIGHTWRTVSLGFAIETLGYYRVTS